VKAKPTSPAPTAAKPAKKPGRKAAVKADVDAPVESDEVPVESSDLTPAEAETSED